MKIVLLAGLLLTALSALAQEQDISIVVDRGEEGAIDIAVVPFGWDRPGRPPVDLASIITNDLNRSGVFAPMDRVALPERPVGDRDISFPVWRRKTSYLVVGKLIPKAQGRYTVQFRLFDVLKRDERLGLGGTQLTGLQFDRSETELRGTAHDISDRIYEAITGLPGAFNTRIAYITEHKGKDGNKDYSLKIADSDGYNATSVLNSRQPIMSPTWSPNGARLAYVSFEGRRASIYLQDLATGSRQRLSSFPGINGAPAFSPDGTRMALTLSKDGNPEIYVLHLRSRKLKRLTRHPAIDTEASWSADGRGLVFTSDRSGGPQIYWISANGGEPKRLTFEGNYNAGASFSPNGREIAMVHNGGRGYQIALMNLETRKVQVLTKSRLDDSPSFSPNGAMVLYSTTSNAGATLAAVTTDGRAPQTLALRSGGLVRDPAWAPSR
ncbi:MAG: Tol-Pal system beta propeller repeat protein TolB [Pseudomonadota bacterium]